MTNKKINTTEFTSWSNEIWKFATTIFKDIEETPEEQKKTSKVISAFCSQISIGNTFALEYFNNIFSERFEILSELVRETEFNFPCEDGIRRKMTGKEWSKYLHQRVEDYHRTRVDKEIEEQDLNLIVQRFKNIKEWYTDKEKQKKLLSEIYWTDKEGWDLVEGVITADEKFFDITEKKMLGNGELTEADARHSPYLLEDLSQVISRANEAIKNKNKEPEKPEKKKEEKEHKIKNLEEEIKELERQKKELERSLSETSLSPTKKLSLEEDLKENKKQREKTQTKLDNLQRELKNTDNDGKNNNLPIYLGIFAAVVAVICLIILLARPRRRDRYQY